MHNVVFNKVDNIKNLLLFTTPTLLFKITQAKKSFCEVRLVVVASDCIKKTSPSSHYLTFQLTFDSLTPDDFATFFQNKILVINASFSSPPESSPLKPTQTLLQQVLPTQIGFTSSSNPKSYHLDPLLSPLTISNSPDLLSFINSTITSPPNFRSCPEALKLSDIQSYTSLPPNLSEVFSEV